MPFELPQESFNALEHAKNKLIRANQFENMIKEQFIASYEDFWGVSGKSGVVDGENVFIGGGSRYTVEQMQAILDIMPQAIAIDVLTDAAAFVQYLNTAYPDVLPERYHTTAFDYTIGVSGITLTNINSFWAQPTEEG